jgi:hypothetical protein
MPTIKHIVLPMLLVVASTGCGDLLFLEVEQPALCKVVENQAFGGSQYAATIDLNVSQEIQGLGIGNIQGVDLFINLQRAKLVARSGISNFDFIDKAKITVMPIVSSGPPPLEVLSYERKGPSGTEVELAAGQPTNISPYITAETLRAEAEISGRLPSENWSIDIEVCLYSRARVNYLQFFGL